jgi:hypothetical protein
MHNLQGTTSVRWTRRGCGSVDNLPLVQQLMVTSKAQGLIKCAIDAAMYQHVKETGSSGCLVSLQGKIKSVSERPSLSRHCAYHGAILI